MRAEFQKNYLMRYIILAAVCLGLGAYFAYDGFIGYPKKLEIAEAYEALADLPNDELEQRWKEVTTEHNWSSSLPTKKAEEIRGDIPGQYFWGVVNLIVGAPALFLFFKSRGSWVEAVDGGVTSSWGQTMKFADVKTLNKQRWEKKGIARATYKDGEVEGTFVFDDFKFDREAIGKMLCDLEDCLEPEQITGGISERDRKKANEENDTAEQMEDEAADPASDEQPEVQNREDHTG